VCTAGDFPGIWSKGSPALKNEGDQERVRAGIVPQLLMTVILAILAHIFTIGTSGQKLQANDNRFAETIEIKQYVTLT